MADFNLELTYEELTLPILLNLDSGAILVYKNDYSSSVTYNYLDFVRYNNELWLFCSSTPQSGVTPVEGEVWSKLSGIGPQGQKGDTGEKGDTGAKGDTGTGATISVGTVQRGENASVTNSGTSSAAVFNFTLPKGDTGDTGASVTNIELELDGDLIITIE